MVMVVMSMRAAFDASDPSCGHRGLVEIEHLGVQYFVKVHICVVAVDYFRSRLKGAYDGPDFFQFFRLDFGSLVKENDIAELYLLDYQIGNVLFTDVLPGKFIPGPRIRPSISAHPLQSRCSPACSCHIGYMDLQG